MIEQPSGTVTLVFTDIEGSTRLLEELGVDGYRDALAEHRRIVREACARFDGYEVDYEGDAFFYAFASAHAAVSAVSDAMVGLERGPIRIRVGIHTGEPALDPPKYVGMDVHRAARIMAAAHGGQAVLSRETAELLDETLPLRDLGDHRFKDLGAPERVYQLGDEDHPPLKSLYRFTLPVPATSFLGREQELTAVVELLADPATRLLTLTGPGGTGKTRLALRAAAETSDRFADGVTWVPLAPLRDHTLLVPTIAAALGVSERTGEELATTLANALLGKEALVLLDNAEQLLPHAASCVATLLADCPTLRLLVTSRERLRIGPEITWPVPPLDASDGERLFVERARAAGVGVEADETVALLSRRLDRLPLAIELAAARTIVFSPAQLLERLGRRLDLLKGGRDADPRQQTLRATIDWSYQLLDDEEQRSYRALSVFAGGCTLEAAEHVAGADPDTLQSLIDKSLVRRSDTDTGPRYWMLESIREHAAGRLRDEAEESVLAHRHAEWFSAVAAGVPEDLRAVVLAPEDDNLRLALGHGTAVEPELAVVLCRILTPYWFYRGRPREAAHWGRALLAATDGERGLRRAHALALAGRFRLFVDDPESARPLLEEAVLTLRREDDPLALARCLADLGMVAAVERRFDDAIAILTEAVGLRGGLDDDPYEATGVQHFLGETLRDAGRLDEARQQLEGVVGALRSIGAEAMAASSTHSLGDLELDAGRPDKARERYCEALEVFRGTNMEREIANCLGGLAAAAATAGKAEHGASLWGALEALEERLELRLFEHERQRYVCRVASACAAHPAAHARGGTWPLEEAIAQALAGPPEPS